MPKILLCFALVRPSQGRQKIVGHCGKAIYILNINTRREISCLSDNGGQRSSLNMAVTSIRSC